MFHINYINYINYNNTTIMTRTTEMNNIIEERNQLCICLYLIKKEKDKRNHEKRKQGDEPQQNLDIFTIPDHIKWMFGSFLKTPLYTELATLRGHTDTVSCLTILKNKLYSGSWDNTIRIWNTETHKKIAFLIGHTDIVKCLTILKNKLYSASNDKTIRIWNTETYEKIATLKDTHPVICIALHENKLYSGGIGKTIRVWAKGTHTETYAEIATLRGNIGYVNCLCAQAHENRLYSGGADTTVRVWKV